MEGILNWIAFVRTNFAAIMDATREHALIVVTVMVAATLFSIAVGVTVHRNSAATQFALGTASVFLTIPSLALFALFIPLVGVGNPPARIALFLYALLPILRNTITGIAGVDPAITESAKGMGMNSRQQLARIVLPLAWPVILAGIRISTQLITGVAAIAVLIGGGGLGSFIQRGLTSLGNPLSIERVWTGTIFIIILALVFDALLAFMGRRTTSPGLR